MKVPRYVRCYDEGQSGDRYTVVFTGRAATEVSSAERWYPYRGMSAHPCDPQGVGQWGSVPNHAADILHEKGEQSRWPPAVGRKCHLGTRIRFQDLPIDSRKLVLSDYREIWKNSKSRNLWLTSQQLG